MTEKLTSEFFVRNISMQRSMLYLALKIKAHANGRHKSQHCCVLLGVFDQQCCVRLHSPKSLTGFKLYVTSANIVVFPCQRTQHVGSNNVACCWPTMLRPFAWAFGSWGGFKFPHNAYCCCSFIYAMNTRYELTVHTTDSNIVGKPLL